MVCYGVADGRFRWASFIANSNSEINNIFADDSLVISDAVSHLAYASGRLFVITDLGAVASLDAFTGTIAWLDIYRKESTQSIMPFNPAMRRAAWQAPQNDIPITATVPWTYNPAVVQNGKLFALPSDSRYLLIYDAGNGNLFKQIDLSELQESRDPNVPYNPDVPNTLLAVKGDLVYLAGARQVWQVPWRSIVPDKPADFTPGYWRSTDDGDQSPQVRGRASSPPTRFIFRRNCLCAESC